MSPRNRELVDIAGEVHHETERGILFYDGEKEVWLPKSLVEIDKEDDTATMPEWLALEKGLI